MTNSFSLERLRELHEAWKQSVKRLATEPAFGSYRNDAVARWNDARGALADYAGEHVPAILALADRLQEADAVIHDLWHQDEPGFKPILDYDTKARLAIAACERHASRPREQREG